MPRPPVLPAPSRGKIYVGVDPGQSGGIVALLGDSISFNPMPSDEASIWNVFEDISLHASQSGSTCMALIESVHAMPKQGVSSSFKFGQNYGFVRACLTAAHIPFTEITPQAWQKEAGVMKRTRQHAETRQQFKARLVVHAQQLFPGKWGGCRSKSDHLAVADALLIAYVARRQNR